MDDENQSCSVVVEDIVIYRVKVEENQNSSSPGDFSSIAVLDVRFWLEHGFSRQILAQNKSSLSKSSYWSKLKHC